MATPTFSPLPVLTTTPAVTATPVPGLTDPSWNTRATRASMPTPRGRLGVAAASNGKIYAIGGYNTDFGGFLSTVEEYDPATNTWATRASMPTARQHPGVAAASNGKIYAIGGNNS